MREPSKKEIENRAYQLWDQHGRPKGRDHEFWQLAEQELRIENESSPIASPAPREYGSS